MEILQRVVFLRMDDPVIWKWETFEKFNSYSNKFYCYPNGARSIVPKLNSKFNFHCVTFGLLMLDVSTHTFRSSSKKFSRTKCWDHIRTKKYTHTIWYFIVVLNHFSSQCCKIFRFSSRKSDEKKIEN